jgi:hypothetical protein
VEGEPTVIVEAIILGVSFVFGSSLWVADRIHKRQVEQDQEDSRDPRETALDNKKAYLEKALNNPSFREALEWPTTRETSRARQKELETQLLAVEDERAKLWQAISVPPTPIDTKTKGG